MEDENGYEKPEGQLNPREKAQKEWEEKVAKMSFKEKLGATAYDFDINRKIEEQEAALEKNKTLKGAEPYLPGMERKLNELREEKQKLAEKPMNYLTDKYEVHVFQVALDSETRNRKFLDAAKTMEKHSYISDGAEAKKIENEMDGYFQGSENLLSDKEKYDKYIEDVANDKDGEFEKFLQASSNLNNLKSFHKGVLIDNSESNIKHHQIEASVLLEKINSSKPKIKVEKGWKGLYNNAKKGLLRLFGRGEKPVEKKVNPLEKELAEKENSIKLMRDSALESKNKLVQLEKKSDVKNKILSDVIDKQVEKIYSDVFSAIEKSDKYKETNYIPESDRARLMAVAKEEVKDTLERWEKTIFDEKVKKMIQEKITKFNEEIKERTKMAKDLGSR